MKKIHLFLIKIIIFFEKMKNLTDFINEELIFEHFVTLFSKEEMEKYGEQAYDMIVKAYEYCGGLAGCKDYSDFKRDYIDACETDKIMWKCVRRGSKITAVRIYTTKRGGRKSMCMASDGTDQGKKDLFKIISEDFKLKDRKTWSEQSGKALGSSLKTGKCLIPNYIIKLLMPDKQIELLDDGFFYLRKIGGELHCKAMVGNPPEGECVSLSDEDIIKYKELAKEYSKKYEGE